MPTPSSQGSTVVFDGIPLGRLTRFRCAPATAVFVDATHVACDVVGNQYNSRLVKAIDCVAIEPGTIEVTMYGVPSYGVNDVGHRGMLMVNTLDGQISLFAYLETFDVTAQVGEFLVGTATFRPTGE